MRFDDEKLVNGANERSRVVHISIPHSKERKIITTANAVRIEKNNWCVGQDRRQNGSIK